LRVKQNTEGVGRWGEKEEEERKEEEEGCRNLFLKINPGSCQKTNTARHLFIFPLLLHAAQIVKTHNLKRN
jgi:hypothetical protein